MQNPNLSPQSHQGTKNYKGVSLVDVRVLGLVAGSDTS
jgi:hypothetical protein